MHGRPFRVVPAVLVRSQVLHNNLGRSFLPAAEFTDEWAELWNGIPVLVGDHPQQHGEDISGRNPALWDERQVGFIFAARIERDGTDARLVAEVWLDETRSGAVNGFAAVLEAVQAGRVVELSTGFRTRIEETAGQNQGEQYDIVLHPAAPDHLVISVDMTGACSVRDGCGLGANCGCGGHAKEAVVEKKGLKGLLARVGELLATEQPATLSLDEQRARRIQRDVEALNEMNPSDQERLTLLRDALQASVGGPDKQVIVTDVFSGESKLVFFFSTPIGAYPAGQEYFMVEYTMGENGAATFSEPTRVRRMTKYEPVANAAPDKSASNAEVATATNSEPSGKERNMADSENKELIAQVTSLVSAVQGLTAKVDAIETAAKSDPNPAIAGLKAQIATLMNEFSQMRGVTEAAVQERERERQDLVKKLVGHYRVPFTLDELEAKPLDELKRLMTMASGADFSGRGGPQGNRAANTEEPRYAEPTSPWAKTDKKDGE